MSGIGGRCFGAPDDARAVFVRDEVADLAGVVVVPVARPVEADKGFFVPAAAGLDAILGMVDAAPTALALAPPCFGTLALLLLGRGSVLSETPPSSSSVAALDSISAGGRRMMGSFDRWVAISFLGSSDA